MLLFERIVRPMESTISPFCPSSQIYCLHYFCCYFTLTKKATGDAFSHLDLIREDASTAAYDDADDFDEYLQALSAAMCYSPWASCCGVRQLKPFGSHQQLAFVVSYLNYWIRLATGWSYCWCFTTIEEATEADASAGWIECDLSFSMALKRFTARCECSAKDGYWLLWSSKTRIKAQLATCEADSECTTVLSLSH